jgi:putative endonuclease
MAIKLGAQGETRAAEFLCTLGFHILVTNLRSRFSEADIIALDGEDIVLVEVKTRSSRFSDPLTALTRAKIQKLRRAMLLLSAKYPNRNIRLDIVTLYWQPEREPEIHHYKQVL